MDLIKPKVGDKIKVLPVEIITENFKLHPTGASDKLSDNAYKRLSEYNMIAVSVDEYMIKGINVVSVLTNKGYHLYFPQECVAENMLCVELI